VSQEDKRGEGGKESTSCLNCLYEPEERCKRNTLVSFLKSKKRAKVNQPFPNALQIPKELAKQYASSLPPFLLQSLSL
jgi:hypothetical protein